MSSIFQMDISLLISSIVLIAMGCVALVFSLALRQKWRALRKLPKDLSAKVYNKTFNVLDTNMEHRRIISGHTGLVVFLAIYGSWIAVTYVVFKAFEVGGILGCVAFLVCAGLLMIEETQELNKNAEIFVKAIESGTGLGEGDLEALALIRHTVPKLSLYHLILAIAFFGSSIAVPYATNAVFLASAGIAAAILAVSASLRAVPMLSLLIIAGLFAVAIVVAQVAVNGAKKRIFGFPSPIPVDILGRQFHRMKMYVGILHHHPTLREPRPEETEKANKKDIEEHGSS